MSELTERAAEMARLAAELPSLDEIRGPPIDGEVIEYECEAGSCTGFYLYKRDGPDGWASQRSRLEAGTRLKRHRQDEMEVLVVIYGRLSVTLNECQPPIELGRGETITMPAGEPHTAVALENTEIVGIAIPSSPGYPSRGSRQ